MAVNEPVIVRYGSTLQVQQLAGVHLAGVPLVFSAAGPRVCHMQDVIAGHGQGSSRASGQRHVDPDVEGVSRRRLALLQLLQERLVL